MHSSFLAVATSVLAFASGAAAWAQAADGTWVANNVWYSFGSINVHESCTTQGKHEYHSSGGCAFWLDGNGNIAHGNCQSRNRNIECV